MVSIGWLLRLATNPFGLRCFVRDPQTDCEMDRADLNLIAVIQGYFSLDARAAKERPIGAAQVLERNTPIGAVKPKTRVAA